MMWFNISNIAKQMNNGSHLRKCQELSKSWFNVGRILSSPAEIDKCRSMSYEKKSQKKNFTNVLSLERCKKVY